MASRLSQRVFAQAVRPMARAARRAGASKRLMSTGEAGAHKQGSDTPWIIGSALVFGPAAVYLLTPPAKNKGHEVAHTHSIAEHGETKPDESVPVKDSEGTEASEDEVSASMQEASNSDAPADAKKAEEAGYKPTQPIADSDGEKASSAEVAASTKKGFDEDSPEDAERAESKGRTEYDQGAPGQTQAAETDKEQNVKPGSKRSGTLQSGGDESTTNMGDARQKAASGATPKEAAGDKEEEESK